MNLMTILLEGAAGAGTGAPAGGGGGMMSSLIMIVLLFVVMYFFMIRPQRKQQKELDRFRNSMEKGQKVVTAGGIYGVVKEVNDRDILMEVDGNVTLRVDKSAIMRDPRS